MNVFADTCEMLGAYGQSWLRRNPAQATHYLRLAMGEMIELLASANPRAAPLFDGVRRMLGDHCVVDSEHVHEVDVVAATQGVLSTILCVGASMGHPVAAAWSARHQASMALIHPGTGAVNRDRNGKAVPPEGWRAPDFAALLDRMRLHSVRDHVGMAEGLSAQFDEDDPYFAEEEAVQPAATPDPTHDPAPGRTATVTLRAEDAAHLGVFLRGWNAGRPESQRIKAELLPERFVLGKLTDEQAAELRRAFSANDRMPTTVMEAVNEGIEDANAGRTVPYEDVRRSLMSWGSGEERLAARQRKPLAAEG